jgi:Fe-S cluster biogenesis protein NfuA
MMQTLQVTKIDSDKDIVHPTLSTLCSSCSSSSSCASANGEAEAEEQEPELLQAQQQLQTKRGFSEFSGICGLTNCGKPEGVVVGG